MLTIRLREVSPVEAASMRFIVLCSRARNTSDRWPVERRDFPAVLEIQQPDGSWVPVPLAE